MKSLNVLLLTVFLAVTVRAQETEATEEIAKIDKVFREDYCKNHNIARKGQCSSLRCNKDNTKTIKTACAEARCSGKTVGFRGDPTKPYPDCCSIPICEDSSD